MPTPLTLLFAPAGMGKTVLAVQWVRGTALDDFDVRWVNAPSSDDPALFWDLCKEAFDPATAKRAAAGAKESVERAVAQLRQPTMLIIDDYQHISSSQLDLDLAALLGLSEHLYLLVISRRFVTLDGPLVTSQTPVTQLRASDLAFTGRETFALASMYGVDDEARVERLHTATRGWPIAVRALMQWIASGGALHQLDGQIARFVVQHTENVASREGWRALLIAVLCDRISIDLLGEELGIDHGAVERLVRELRELGLIDQSWQADTVRISAHPGVSRTLSTNAVQEFGVEQARTLQRRHARNLSQVDPCASALLLLRIRDLEGASRVVARNFLDVVNEEGGLLGALRQIPLDDMNQYVVLLGARLLLEMSVLSTPREELKMMHQRLRHYARQDLKHVDGELRITSLALLIAVERMRGNGAEALRLARDLEQRLAQESEYTAVLLRRSLSIINAIIAFTGVLTGDFGLAERGYLRAFQNATENGNVAEQLRSWNGLAFVSVLSGNMVRGREYLGLVRECQRRSGLRGPHQSWLNGAAAGMLVSFEAGDVERVRANLAEISPLIVRSEQWPILTMVEVMVTRRDSGNEEAVKLIRRRTAEAEAVFGSLPFLSGFLLSLVADFTALGGNYVRAEELLRELPDTHPFVAISTARLKMLNGDLNGSAAIIAAALDARPPQRLRVDLELIGAVTKYLAGSHEAAIDLFLSAAELMQEQGLWYPMTMVPYNELLAIAKRAAREGGPDLVARIEAFPDTERCVRFEVLSPAELRTLEEVAQGGTVGEIAERLFITQNTVKFHLRAIYRKLRVARRKDAVKQAQQIGLI
ncbi:MAG: LuxR C-terminal-related transcriptional regulator [Leucobacter sp.]